MDILQVNHTPMKDTDKKALMYGFIGLLIGSSISFAVINYKLDTQAKETTSNAVMVRTINLMSRDLSQLRGEEFDRAYLQYMINAHEGVIALANKAKKQSQTKEVQTISDKIISSQVLELDKMKQIQEKID